MGTIADFTSGHKAIVIASSNSQSRDCINDPHRLAKLFLRDCSYDTQGRVCHRFWRGEWWHWKDGRYHRVSDGDITATITQVIKREFDHVARATGKQPQRVTRGLVADVKHALTSLVIVPEHVEQPANLATGETAMSFMSFQNGIVDLATLLANGCATLVPPTPDWFSPITFGYPYEPAATCPRWLAFLDEVLEGDQQRISLLQEWFGYCLTPDTSHQKFMAFEGEGSNGKGVVTEVLTQLVDPSNVSNVPLEVFRDRFQLTPTLGKLVNIAPEVDAVGIVAEGVVKQFVGGDRMYFDRKGIPGVEAYPTARIVLAFNTRPTFVDTSSGLWRRMILIPFNVTIPEHRQDRSLARTLAAQELPGIFIWAIAGLRRLRQNRGFTQADVCAQAVGEYQAESNPARVFLTEYCTVNSTGEVVCQHVYASYREWSESQGYKSLNASQLGREVRRAFPTVLRERGKMQAGGRPHVYRGMTLT